MSETELYRQALQTLLRHDLTVSERADAEDAARKVLLRSEERLKRKLNSDNFPLRGRSWAASAWLACHGRARVSSVWHGGVAGFRLVRAL